MGTEQKLLLAMRPVNNIFLKCFPLCIVHSQLVIVRVLAYGYADNYFPLLKYAIIRMDYLLMEIDFYLFEFMSIFLVIKFVIKCSRSTQRFYLNSSANRNHLK